MLFTQHLALVQHVTRFLCKRHGFTPVDAEDCLSWVALKLIEDDYAVFRSFRRASTMRTFLTAVVAMLVRDYRVQHWGRWRPSTAAKRLGPVAVRLETLVYRDGVSLRDAMQNLRTEGVSLSDRELVDVFRALPSRQPMRPRETDADLLDTDGMAASSPEALLDAKEREEVDRIILTAVEELNPADRAAILLHYFEGLTLADVARGLGVPQKPLYRRMERLLTTLRHKLEYAGVSRERAMAALADCDA